MRRPAFVFLFSLVCYLGISQEPGIKATIKVTVPSFKSTFLNENEKQSVFVYLPPSYLKDTTKVYPVVYFLSGYGMGLTGFSIMDQLIATGKVKEMIVVSPNNISKLVGAFYVNSPLTGNWEDYICRDLISYIDTNYRTIPKSSARAVAGHSMGGFGALNLAMLHPDVYCIGYGISPGLFEENGLFKSPILTSTAKNKYFAFVESVKDLSKADAHTEYLKFIQTLKPNEDDIFAIAYGSAFSSDTSLKAPYLNYPYFKNGSEIITDSAFLKNYDNGFGNLKEKAEVYRSNLEMLKGYVIEYGTADNHQWIPKGCIYFDQVLTDAGLTHTYSPFAGDHGNMLSLRISGFMLPYCSSVLEFDTIHFNTHAKITGIKITNQIGEPVIDTLLKTVSVIVKASTDLSKLKPAIYISSGAQITPSSNVETDFSSGSVTYSLVSEHEKTSEEWKVLVSKVATDINDIPGSNDFLVYPNPATNKLCLKFSQQVISIQISDVAGRVLLKNNTYSIDSGINITELKAGIYFLSVKGNKDSYITKFLKE